ncbi:hypothetical protein Vi05172_g3842 [Venturia inaequalis]|nr:hypothetical protein Vi05172_g3842 [Venturia inaequalis]
MLPFGRAVAISVNAAYSSSPDAAIAALCEYVDGVVIRENATSHALFYRGKAVTLQYEPEPAAQPHLLRTID